MGFTLFWVKFGHAFQCLRKPPDRGPNRAETSKVRQHAVCCLTECPIKIIASMLLLIEFVHNPLAIQYKCNVKTIFHVL